MTVELTTPTAHDAQHDVDIQITNAATVFSCEGFLCIGATEEDVKTLIQQLTEWLRSSVS